MALCNSDNDHSPAQRASRRHVQPPANANGMEPVAAARQNPAARPSPEPFETNRAIGEGFAPFVLDHRDSSKLLRRQSRYWLVPAAEVIYQAYDRTNH